MDPWPVFNIHCKQAKLGSKQTGISGIAPLPTVSLNAMGIGEEWSMVKQLL